MENIEFYFRVDLKDNYPSKMVHDHIEINNLSMVHIQLSLSNSLSCAFF